MLANKNQLKAFLCRIHKNTGLAWLLNQLEWLRRHQRITVLLFHRVTDTIAEDGLTVHPTRFRQMCKLLARPQGPLRVVPLSEVFRLVNLSRAGVALPAGPPLVAITFDDCYLDNLQAARVLAELELPATFFLPTGYVETKKSFFWDTHLPQQPNLSWTDVREMSRLGFEFGSHTVTHVDLGRVNNDLACKELKASKAMLEEQLEQQIRWLAYPFGGFAHFRLELLPLCQQLGYEGVLNATGGAIYLPLQPPHIPSIPILTRQAATPFHNLEEFELHLRGSLDWMYTLKRWITPTQPELRVPVALPEFVGSVGSQPTGLNSPTYLIAK